MHAQRGFALKKFLLWTLLIVLAAGGVWLSKLIWFKPFNIDHFYNRVFIEYALEDPELLTRLRVLPPWIDYYKDDLTDVSMQRQRELLAEAKENLAILRSYDREDQTESQRLSTDILDWFLSNNIAGEPYLFHNYPVNQLFGVQNNLPEFMAEQHQIDEPDDAAAYIARLEKFDWKFDQVLEGLRYREAQGILPPRFVVEKVLKGMRDFVAAPAEENILYTAFERKLGELENLAEAERAALLTDARAAIETDVYPAYGALIEYFEGILPRTTDEAGVWKFPGGEGFYAYRLRSFTTTDMSPEQVHRLGLEQVEKISAEMDAILDAEGYTEGTVGERMAALAEEERFLYPDTDAGRERILADYQAIIDEISAGLDEAFNIRPQARVEVRRVPEFRQATAPGAYYNAPAMDGSRPGVFYANLRSVKEIPKFGMRTLAYHEAVPGHHFQIAIQQELKGLPIFRTMPLFTAYTEGWALYAEQVAAELGFQEDPYDRLGYLQAALFRAVRLVVDTGIHHKRWTREQAIDYMRATTGMPQSDVVAEIERYIVMPGQACAYMVGKLKILELRERARDALDESFSLAEFHDVVLKNGAVPLDLLERIVEDWIEEKTAKK